MYEYNFTQNLFENILIILSRNRYPRIKSINLGFGPFADVNFEKMKLCWTDLTDDTLLNNVHLKKKDIEGKLYCDECRKEYSMSNSKLENFNSSQEIFLCPVCKSHKTKILSGIEIIILSLEVDSIDIPR